MKILRRLVVSVSALLGCALLCLLILHKNSSIRTEVWIQCSSPQVWHVLTATAEYSSWNPMISRIQGDLREGNVIEVTFGSGSDRMTLHPKVLTVHTAKELRWKGHILFPGIFDGDHQFYLEQIGGKTHLVQSEEFTGLLVGKLTQPLLKATSDQMNSLNLALKRRAEVLPKAEAP